MPRKEAEIPNRSFTWSSLPVDLLFEIAKYLDFKVLRLLATVSSPWVSPARSVAFHEITINSNDQVFFKLAESPYCTFSLHVQRLRFYYETETSEILAIEIAKALKLLPNVTWFGFKNCLEVYSPYTGPLHVFEQIRGLELEINYASTAVSEAQFFSKFFPWFPRTRQLGCNYGDGLMWSLGFGLPTDRNVLVNPPRDTKPSFLPKPEELYLYDRDCFLVFHQLEMMEVLVCLANVQKVTVIYRYNGPFSLCQTDVIMQRIAGSLGHLTLDLPLSGRSNVNDIVKHNSNLHTLELRVLPYNFELLLSVLETITTRRLRLLTLYINFDPFLGVCTALITALQILAKRRDVYSQLKRVVYDVRLFDSVPYENDKVGQILERFKGEDLLANVDVEVNVRPGSG